MAKQRVNITPRKLRKVYYVEHRSAAQTAVIFNCSATTIKNYLEKYRFRVKTTREVMKGRKITDNKV